MQKSILPIVLLPSLALALTACGSGEPQSIVLPTTTAAAPIQTHTPNQADTALTQELEKAQNELKALNEKLAEIQKNPADTPAADQPASNAPNQADSALAQKLEKAQSEIKALTEKLAEIQKNTNTAAGTTPAPTTPAPTTTVAPPPAVSNSPSGTHPAPQPPTTQPPTATMPPPATDNSSGQPSSSSSPAPATGGQNTGDSAPTPPNNVVNPPPAPPSVAPTPPASGGTSANTGSTGDSSTGTAPTGGGTSAGTSGDGSSDAGTPSGQPSDGTTSTPVLPPPPATGGSQPPVPPPLTAAPPTTPKEPEPVSIGEALKSLKATYTPNVGSDYRAFSVAIDHNKNTATGNIINTNFTTEKQTMENLTIGGVNIKLLPDTDTVLLRKMSESEFAEGEFDVTKDSFVGRTYRSGDWDDPAGQFRYGVYNSKDGKTQLFVYGKPMTWNYPQYNITFYGSAIIGKQGKYRTVENAVKAELNVEKNDLDISIKLAPEDILKVKAKVSKHGDGYSATRTFDGESATMKVQGGFFGKEDVGGIFEVLSGEHKDENGVFGASLNRKAFSAFPEEDRF